ncbi:hypothetical protein ACIOJD_10375 [Streptomyces sp. NPDC088116]|uniref:hypothetical protein n=1 Tax=Streptomyces sp. NPDC088116 TaxID=3365825 RepID=UPI0038180F6F
MNGIRPAAPNRAPLCDYCGHVQDALTVVGVVHSASGPGRAVHACGPCRASRRLVPLAEHPADSLGLVLVEPRR